MYVEYTSMCSESPQMQPWALLTSMRWWDTEGGKDQKSKKVEKRDRER